jgi:tape measure domain-containing protein
MAKQRTTVVSIDYKVNTVDVEKGNALLNRASQSTDKLRDSLGRFKKSSDDAAASLNKVGNDGIKSFVSLNNFVKTISFAALATGIASVAKKIFDLGVAQEQTNIAFETLVGNTQKAKQLLSELTKFSIETPFTPDQVNRAAKSLLAFGVQAEDIIPTLKLIGDVSSGTGKDLSEMAVIFGQIRSTGRLMGQDLLQLINAGFNPLQIISQKTGRSMRDLKKDMENGLISFQMVEDAFKTATSEGGLFFDLMSKQSDSIGGKLSTIEGNIDEIQKKLFEANKGGLAEFIGGVAKLTGNVEELASVFNVWFSMVTSVPAGLIRFFNSIAERASASAKETERVRMEFLALQLALAKGDLDTFNQTGLGDRVKIIERIVDLLNQMGVKQPTTEDPLPWANQPQGEEKIGIIEKLEQKIKQLNEEIKKTQDLGDLGASGRLIKDLQDTQDELDKLLGKQTDSEKQHEKEAEKLRKEALENTRKHLKEVYEKRKRAGDDAAKIEAENDKRSFELWKYFQDLRIEKKREYEDEQIAIMEDAAARKRRIEEDLFNGSLAIARALIDFMFNSRSNEQEQVRENFDEQIKLAGDNERARKELEIKRERSISAARERDKEEEKKQARNKILAGTAVNIVEAFPNYILMAVAAALGAVQLAEVQKLKDGVIDLKGPGTKTSDSIPARLSKGESVMTADETASSKGIFKAVRARKLNDKVLKEITSGKSGGQSIQSFDDSRLLKKLDEVKNATPDVKRVGNLMYETKVKTDTYKMWVRSKSMNS